MPAPVNTAPKAAANFVSRSRSTNRRPAGARLGWLNETCWRLRRAPGGEVALKARRYARTGARRPGRRIAVRRGRPLALETLTAPTLTDSCKPLGGARAGDRSEHHEHLIWGSGGEELGVQLEHARRAGDPFAVADPRRPPRARPTAPRTPRSRSAVTRQARGPSRSTRSMRSGQKRSYCKQCSATDGCLAACLQPCGENLRRQDCAVVYATAPPVGARRSGMAWSTSPSR
jgi:hypothetical protein